MIYQVIFILIFDICNSDAIFAREPNAVILPKRLIKTPGSMVEVKCHLLKPQHPVFDLQLLKVKDKQTTVLNSTVVDNTTIKASFGPVDLDDNRSYIYCISYTSTLARKRLLVDGLPTAPTKMECISYHLITMECRFTPFVQGNLITDWIIQYTNSGFGGIYTTCQSAKVTECILGSSKDNLANPFYPMMNHTFRVNVTNYLGSSISLFQVDPWEVVKPDPVSDLHVEVLNSTCIKVTWSYPSFPLLPLPLEYHVSANSSLLKTKKVVTNLEQEVLCDLSPNTEVKVTVHCETTVGGYPSDIRSVTAQMPEDKPRPPVVPIGAFSAREIANTTREITLYWQTIPSGFQHGTITHFKVSVFNDTSASPIFTQAIAPTSLTAVISPGLKNDANYRILIQAKTAKGYSDVVETAMVNVSQVEKVINRPVWVDSELVGQGVHAVYWSAETDHRSVTRVYWCYGQSKSDGQVICYTSIQMKRSSTNSSEHMVQVDDGSIKRRCDTCQWNFGVSMETNDIFSGIVWNGCKYRRYKDPRLDDVFLSNVTSSSVTVTWQHTCWLVNQFGRPEYYELGVVDDETDDRLKCNDIKVTKVPAKHGEMIKTITTEPKTSLCIRAVGRNKTGAWVIRPIILHGLNHGLSTEVVAGMSASLIIIGLVLMLLIVRLCARKKWFDKIYIELPPAMKSHLHEGELFKSSIVKMKDNPLYVRNELNMSGSSATKETIVSDSAHSPKIYKDQKDNCINSEDSKQKIRSDKGCTDFATDRQCSTISTEVTIEDPHLTEKGALEEAKSDECIEKSDDAKHLMDNCYKYGTVLVPGDIEYPLLTDERTLEEVTSAEVVNKSENTKHLLDNCNDHNSVVVPGDIDCSLLTGEKVLEITSEEQKSKDCKHSVDNCNECDSISGPDDIECKPCKKHSIDGSMAAFSGSFDEDGSDFEGSLSYVQAGCDIATLQEREALLKEVQAKGDNSRRTENEAELKSSKYSVPSIDGSNYLLLNHTTNPFTGCNYYHHENINTNSENGLLKSDVKIFYNDKHTRHGHGRTSNSRKTKHKWNFFL